MFLLHSFLCISIFACNLIAQSMHLPLLIFCLVPENFLNFPSFPFIPDPLFIFLVGFSQLPFFLSEYKFHAPHSFPPSHLLWTQEYPGTTLFRYHWLSLSQCLFHAFRRSTVFHSSCLFLATISI